MEKREITFPPMLQRVFWIVVTAMFISTIAAVYFMTNLADKNDTNDNLTDAVNDFENRGILEQRGGVTYLESENGTENQQLIFSEGNFDNIMGYSGHYIYYEGCPSKGYYYASDGTLLAYVWGGYAGRGCSD